MLNHKYALGACVFIASVLFSTTVYADSKSCGAHKLDMKVSKMQQKLNLSDEQADNIYKIFATKYDAKPCAGIESFSERKACRMEQRESVNTQIMSILTEEQQVSYQSMKAEKWNKGKDRHGKKGRSS